MASEDSQPYFTGLDNENIKINDKTFLFGPVIWFSLFLFTFVFVYLIYLCSHRAQLVTGGPNADQASPPAGAEGSVGLNPATINVLPILLYCSSGSNTACQEGDCSICLGTFQDGEKVKVLPACNHSFHCECVDKWLRTQSSCPLCRTSVL